VRVLAPQEPTFVPAFTVSLAARACPVRRSEQFRSCHLCRVALAQRRPVWGQPFFVSRSRVGFLPVVAPSA
jgi:hypothetical protein